VTALNPDNNRLLARRLGDDTLGAFCNDYVREHITRGYAVTVHSAQGVTASARLRGGIEASLWRVIMRSPTAMRCPRAPVTVGAPAAMVIWSPQWRRSWVCTT
jgi:hypothetical protein